ncbi:DUF58 domain-containing protein [Notoacmeibacter ruber]|uniref:DUF58 domain-containing protein n=1 Tax=Notoacmeibacter ruber TaxID=2670375 RepID=A0A3L7JD19_9HYPH|nr:DUF58 domain-containing protein [Notoacmeibacter ruber]RLQ88354.1 DUF58 domain-containing protein [Notoacmeibacter ruber]
MAAIGTSSAPVAPQDALARARERAAFIPDLLVEARRIAAAVLSGWHGRRRRGIGEDFWQYRPYTPGETMARIDWRRSARDDHVYVRDNEWQSAHTVWLWADPSPSMLFQSQGANVSKESRGIVLALALAELLARSGERIGWLGLSEPVATRNAAERLASRMLMAPLPERPDFKLVSGRCDVVLISDFLDDVETLQEMWRPLAKRGARGHLIEISDPAEENFPYGGRTRFIDPETGERLTAGRAEDAADAYRDIYQARRDEISRDARRLGWSYTLNHTDQLASEALVHVHQAMTTAHGSGQ